VDIITASAQQKLSSHLRFLSVSSPRAQDSQLLFLFTSRETIQSLSPATLAPPVSSALATASSPQCALLSPRCQPRGQTQGQARGQPRSRPLPGPAAPSKRLPVTAETGSDAATAAVIHGVSPEVMDAFTTPPRGGGVRGGFKRAASPVGRLGSGWRRDRQQASGGESARGFPSAGLHRRLGSKTIAMIASLRPLQTD